MLTLLADANTKQMPMPQDLGLGRVHIHTRAPSRPPARTPLLRRGSAALGAILTEGGRHHTISVGFLVSAFVPSFSCCCAGCRSFLVGGLFFAAAVAVLDVYRRDQFAIGNSASRDDRRLGNQRVCGVVSTNWRRN